MKKMWLVLTAAAFVASWMPAVAQGQGNLQVLCRADVPTHPGEIMTWRAIVEGSGSYTYSWSGDDGLSGSMAVVRHAYPAVGYKVAQVDVTDTVTDEQGSAGCAMHVVPVSFVEPPSVTPVLWVPNDVDPEPMIARLRRVWRSIHATFQDFYGKTFRMSRLVTIVSPKTERDICGGDCSDLLMGNKLMGVAFEEADAAIGGTIPYTRAMLVTAWGAGGFAGAYGWDIGLGGVGDVALAPAVGLEMPPIQTDFHEGFLATLGDYRAAIVDSIAHELNHVIGWDDPHNFSRENPPNAYERRVSLAGPFLTQRLADDVDPGVAFTSPGEGAKLSRNAEVSVAASDDVAMDAVVLLVDGQFEGLDKTAPFGFHVKTRLYGHDEHTLTAIAYDATGNTSEASRRVVFENRVSERSCKTRFLHDTLHVCYFDGVGFDGPYLGSLVDHPFPIPTSNAGFLIKHTWDADEIAFGQTDTVSGLWRGRLTFPPANYVLRFFTDDGLRVFANGVKVIDEWRDQVLGGSVVVHLAGVTRIKVQWYENEGSAALHLAFQPTAQKPPG
jgi:hypothetical protein